MADYASLELRVRYGEVSDYSDRLLDRPYTSSSTTPTKQQQFVVSAATTGTTLDLGHFSTVEYLIIKNKDATNYVTAAWYEVIGTRTAGNLALVNGSPDKLEDENNADFTTFGAAAGRYVRVSAAAEDAANQNDLYLIQSVQDKDATNDEITLAQDATLTANADDDSAVLTFERYNEHKITAGKVVALSAISVASDLLLTANTSAVEVEVVVIGT